jgi:tape measure domain-containing protein
MPSIDERVVAMAFENAKFEAGVARTMATLTKLDASLQQIGTRNSLGDIEKSANKVTLQGPTSALDKLRARFGRVGVDAAQGMSDVEKAGNKITLAEPARAVDGLKAKLAELGGGGGAGAAAAMAGLETAANKVDLGGLDTQVSTVKKHFDAMRFAAIVAFGTIVHRATNVGLNLVKSVTVQPLIDGFHNYETQINAVQTIMANTGLVGKKGLGEVQKALDELNTYANQTVYNFSEMARNIGTFTAAGVDLKTATASIKGIANLAALSGSNSQQASTAMYQLSQAIASGKVGLQDWNSVVNAGMGGKVFQKALANTAMAMGGLKDGSVKLVGPMKQLTINGNSFRQSIQAKPGQKTWLTSDVLTKTLQQFTGDMTDAQLAADGFSASQIKAIQAQAKAARGAAVNIKTISQLMQALKEEVASAFSSIFKTLFGDIFSATTVFSKLHNAAQNALTGPIYALNKVLQGWVKLGGRTILIDALKQGLEDIRAIIKPIQAAFREVFPAQTPKGLLSMTKGFAGLMKHLKPSAQTVDGLKRTFAGLFAVLHIGWTIIKDVIKVIAHLLGEVGKGSGGFLGFTGGIGDLLVAFDKVITKGGALEGFFSGLEAILKVPLHLLGSLAGAIAGLFGGATTDGASRFKKGMDGVRGAASPLANVLDRLKTAWQNVVQLFEHAKEKVQPALDQIGQAFSAIVKKIGEAFSGHNFDSTLAVVQTGFLGSLVLIIKKNLGQAAESFTGILKPVNAVLGQATANLKAMQRNVQAQTITLIAVAIGLLAASVLALSKVNPKQMTTAMTSIAVGLGMLVGSMKLMTSGLGTLGFAQAPLIAGSLVILAGSLVILAAAMKIFATMSWEEMAKGLIGVGGGLAAMALGMKAMSVTDLIQAPAILVIAVAMNALAAAIKQFGGLKWDELAKGIAGVFTSLLAVTIPLQEAGPQLAVAALALIPVALGVGMLAGAVKAFGSISWDELAKGVLGAAAALVAIGLALDAFPIHSVLLGPGLLLVAVGLTAMSGAVKAFGSMDISTLAKGIIAIGLSLVTMAAGLTAMIASLPGAAALLVAAGALALLAPSIAFLGNLDWGTILKGLAALALTLGTLSIVGLVVAPGLVSLGIALLPLGIAFATVAAAAYLFAKAVNMVADNGAKGVGVLILAITSFVALLPKFVEGLAKGFLEVLDQVAKVAPHVADALVKITAALLDGLVKVAPKMGLAIGSLVDVLLQYAIHDSPKLMKAGVIMVLNLLKGIDKNIKQVTNRVVNIIVKWLNTMANRAPDLTKAGARALVAFLKGIGDHINQITKYGIRIVVLFIAQLARLPAKVAGVAADGMIKFLNKIGDKMPDIIQAAVKMAGKFLKGLAKGMVKITNTAADALVLFLNGLAKAIRNKSDDIRRAGWNIVSAIVEGMLGGFRELWHKVKEKAEALADHIPGPIKKALSILSPSRVMWEIGKNVVLGLAFGIGDNAHYVSEAMRKVGTKLKGEAAISVVDIAGIMSIAMQPLANLARATKSVKEFKQLLGTSFKEDLTGGIFDHNAGKSEAEIKIEDTFKSLGDKLKEERGKLAEQVKADRKRLAKLMGSDEADFRQIENAYHKLTLDTLGLASATAASHNLMNALDGRKEQLKSLAAQYDLVTAQLAKAQDVFNSYDTLPDFTKLVDDAVADAGLSAEERMDKIRKDQEEKSQREHVDQVALYKQALADQVAATQEYMKTLKQLRAAGLDDATYQKLLDQGTAGQEFASQLLAGGKVGIEQINKLDAQLAKASSQLATNAAKALITAGDQAAQGLITGLQKRQDQIRKTMEQIAGSMIKAIKSQLGIKSPSQVFAEIGLFSIKGLADGLTSSSGLVQTAAASVGDDAANAMTKSLANISDSVQNGINTDVTITPVLDLSQAQKDARKIGDLADVIPITAAASYGQAAAISQEAQATATAKAAEQSKVEINLEQNNTSPKALSETEIYRQTKNQLSQVKSVLGLVASSTP